MAIGQDKTRSANHPTMAELIKLFQSSPTPKRGELRGDWVVVTTVNTERFLAGQDGPDHITFDSTGIRRGAGDLDWRMSVEERVSGIMFVSTTLWTEVEHSRVVFNKAGEVTFTKDYGGDTPYSYRCRSPSSKRLLCLIDIVPSGHAIEFRRVR
jgi:hypothetical protein